MLTREAITPDTALIYSHKMKEKIKMQISDTQMQFLLPEFLVDRQLQILSNML